MADTRNLYDGELLNAQGQTVAIDGDWVELKEPKANFGQAIPMLITVSAGTGTVVVQGRNSPADSPSQITSTGASAAVSASAYRQYRARITSVTGSVSVVVSIPYPVKRVL